MILKKDNIVLRPTNDISYIIELAKQYKYNKLNDQTSADILKDYGYKYWNCFRDGKKYGVVYLCYVPQLGYTLDAYKDQRVKSDIKYSTEAGRLVVDYFHKEIFPVLWTSHDIRNRLATLVCRKIGFKKHDTIHSKLGEFILMRRDKWQNSQKKNK